MADEKREHPTSPDAPPPAEPQPEGPVEVQQENVVDQQLQSALAEVDELKDQLLRTRAEMENSRKRMQRERDEERRYAAVPLMMDLLPALDNLRRAIEAGRSADDMQALLQGVQMVLRQFEDVIAAHGARPIEAEGRTFDPHRHEALQQQPTRDHPPMTVLQELQRGYQLHERVIRPSQVIVASAPPDEQT